MLIKQIVNTVNKKRLTDKVIWLECQALKGNKNYDAKDIIVYTYLYLKKR